MPEPARICLFSTHRPTFQMQAARRLGPSRIWPTDANLWSTRSAVTFRIAASRQAATAWAVDIRVTIRLATHTSLSPFQRGEEAGVLRTRPDGTSQDAALVKNHNSAASRPIDP